METLLELQGVGFRVGAVDILRGVDLTVAPGTAVGVEGANGAGKTTLLRLCATLQAPTSGGGHILGAPLGTADAVTRRPQIALLAHQPALHADLTLRENLEFYARLAGRPASHAAELLSDVGLAGAADRVAAEASQGMQRRVDIARVLLTEPRILLLDEPHAGLDAAAEALVAAAVERTTRTGGGALVVSHDASRLRAIAAPVHRLAGGTLT